MTSIQTAPREKAMPVVDEEGFLLDPEMWSRDFAQTLAAEEVAGGLTEDHWKVIDFLRDYYYGLRQRAAGPDVAQAHRREPSKPFTGFFRQD